MSKLEDLDYVDNDGRSLIFYAIFEGQLNAVELLIRNHVDLNIKDINGWTPLHYAVSENYPEIVKLLLENGAEVNVKDAFGNTPIWRAVFTSKGRGDIIKLLLDKGADPQIKNNSDVSAYELAKAIANYDVKQFFSPDSHSKKN